jgi:hypothetical protein
VVAFPPAGARVVGDYQIVRAVVNPPHPERYALRPLPASGER